MSINSRTRKPIDRLSVNTYSIYTYPIINAPHCIHNYSPLLPLQKPGLTGTKARPIKPLVVARVSCPRCCVGFSRHGQPGRAGRARPAVTGATRGRVGALACKFDRRRPADGIAGMSRIAGWAAVSSAVSSPLRQAAQPGSAAVQHRGIAARDAMIAADNAKTTAHHLKAAAHQDIATDRRRLCAPAGLDFRPARAFDWLA